MEKYLLNAGPSERGWHGFETVARCPRLYAWQKVAGLQFPHTDPLGRGSLLHMGLAHYYVRKKEEAEGRNPETYYSPAVAIRILAEEEAGKADANTAALWTVAAPEIMEVLDHYIEHYSYCGWKVVDVEKEMRADIPLGDSTFLFTQRVDLIVEETDGRIWFVDHKSAYRIVAKTLHQHILSGQFLGYQTFGRAKYGDRFAGVIINRVKLRAPFQYDRAPLEPAPHALKRFVPMLKTAEETIQKYKGVPPEDWPAVYSDQICWGKYGRCSAFDLCQWGKS